MIKSMPELHYKVWGFEEWIINSHLYCGKKLYIQKQYKMSDHFHKLKDETFYIFNGVISMNVNGRYFVLYPGESIHIGTYETHSIIALKNSIVFEFSTQHFETDSYRFNESRKLTDEEFEEALKQWKR